MTSAQTGKPLVAAGAEVGEGESGQSAVAVGLELAGTLRGPRGVGRGWFGVAKAGGEQVAWARETLCSNWNADAVCELG